jgi:hypothetical protein
MDNNRITDFDDLPGKTIGRIVGCGEWILLLFTDQTWMHIARGGIASGLSTESTLSDYQKCEAGLMSRDEYERIELEHRRRVQEHRDKIDRESYEKLKEKFGNS